MDQNDDELHFEFTHISRRPLMVCDIKKRFEQVDKAYDYLRTCDEEVRNILEPIISIACDEACNLCYELGFEYPEDVAETPYYRFTIRNL